MWLYGRVGSDVYNDEDEQTTLSVVLHEAGVREARRGTPRKLTQKLMEST